MRVAAVSLLALVALVATSAVAFAGPDDGGGGPPLIPGSRQVHIRNASGGLGVYTTIPSGSAFRSHGGGAGAECSGVGPGDDPDTLDVVEEVRAIRSTKWIFIEGVVAIVDIPAWLYEVEVVGPSLAETVRTFSVYCADTYYASNFRGFVQVPGTDPMLDPRPRLTSLYNDLQLEELSLYENDVVGEWGGLVVRSPAWLAIGGSAWRTQMSNVEYWRGWELALVTRPVALDFEVVFVEDPDRPSSLFSGVVPCVGAGDDFLRVDNTEFPSRPNALADFAEPGSNQDCEWTPPGPGEVTITARQTFAVSFWASGAVEPQPDYVWESSPVSFRVGELVAVNVND